MIDENPPFAWMYCMENDRYSDKFNALIRNRTSSMREEDCRKLVESGYPYFGDLDANIKLIKDARQALKKIEPKVTDSYLVDAYPFELLFQFRY